MVQRMLDGQVATKWATDITLVVTVKWAGCGGMYIAVLYAVQALEAIYHKRIKVELYASSDWEAHCQDMLLCFEEGHIFQDMLDRYNDVLVEGIKQKQNAAYHKLETFMKQRTTYTQRQAKKRELTFELKRQILELAREHGNKPFSDDAVCVACSKRDALKLAFTKCKHQPPTFDDKENVIHLELVSPSCVAWSSRGKQWG